jgi:pimeloyl-ACP methyl ester carboxylesterase
MKTPTKPQVVTGRMERAAIDGVELEYQLRGSGEPVVLIHWGVSAAWAEPLMDEPALADRYRLLSYHRAGFAGSDRIEGPVSIGDHARHCALLMRQLGIERAHIVGHSSSAVIALQLALDFPDAVHTLALMEPARPFQRTEEQQAEIVRDVVGPRFSAIAPATRPRPLTPGPAGSSDRTTVARWSGDYQGPSTSASPTRTRSSPRRCPPSSSGRLRRRTPAASLSPRSPLSATTPLRPFSSGCNCSSPGCRTCRPSSYRGRPTCCTCRTRAERPRP